MMSTTEIARQKVQLRNEKADQVECPEDRPVKEYSEGPSKTLDTVVSSEKNRKKLAFSSSDLLPSEKPSTK